MMTTETQNLPAPARVNRPITIDVEAIIAAKTGGKKLPAFVVRWIKNFIHQDFLNAYFEKGEVGMDFSQGALDALGVTIEVIGRERIPQDGLYTFVGNHPLGGIDALAVINEIGRRWDGNIRFVANDFLMNLTQLAEYMTPVNKLSNRQAGTLGQDIDEMFASDKQISWFPAGACSRQYNGVITDPEWRKTFITKTRKAGRPVVPMWFSGQNSKRFYWIDRFCRFFKIKTNIAMFFLPDELYRGRNKKYTLVFGDPIPAETFTRDRKDKEWAEWVREKVYALKTDRS